MFDKDKVLYFLAIIILLSFTSYGVKHYSNLKETFEEETIVSRFLSNEQMQYQRQSNGDEVLFLNAMTALKEIIAKRLCVIKNILESSISIAQITLPESEKDDIYDITKDLTADNDIGGTYIEEVNQDSRAMLIVTAPNKCGHKTWIPDELKKKESIVGYTSRLVRYYNKKVLELNKIRVITSEYTDEFMRLLIENLDQKLLGRCDVCTSEDCTSVLCINPDEDETIKLASSKKLLIKKVEDLETMLCEYTNLYKHLGDIQKVVLQYTNELQDLITNKKKSIGGHMTLNLLKEERRSRRNIPFNSSQNLINGVTSNNKILQYSKANYGSSRRRFRGVNADNNIMRV